MKVALQDKATKGDALFLFISEKPSKTSIDKFGKATASTINKLRKQKLFEGKKEEILPLEGALKSHKQVILIGTGKGEKEDEMRVAAGHAIKKAKKLKASQVTFWLDKTQDALMAVSGGVLGNYEFKVGDTKKQFSPKKLNIATTGKITKKEIDKAAALAESTCLTRDLINLPPNMMTPKILAAKAKKVASGVRNPVSVKILGEKAMAKLGMGSLLGVGQGSDEESQLIVFQYNGGKKSEKPLAIVGKGVCFDSGGYNIKPTGHIEDMKSDMSGAATVVGMFNYIAKTKPKQNIIGVIGAVENLINGVAYKPSDIITAMNGDTIEVTNTDAEGRLVLADALYYTATKLKPAKIIDLATLTGACIAALGYEITAVMGNNDDLLKEVKSASKKAGEDVWELPITDHFREKIKGSDADLINWTAGVSAGSAMGGAFLERFVEKTPWVHMDIAGTAFHSKSDNSYTPKGATGVMMRTLSEWIEA